MLAVLDASPIVDEYPSRQPARQQAAEGQGGHQHCGDRPGPGDNHPQGVPEIEKAVLVGQPAGGPRPDGQPHEDTGDQRRREAAFRLRRRGRQATQAEDCVKVPGAQGACHHRPEKMSAQERR